MKTYRLILLMAIATTLQVISAKSPKKKNEAYTILARSIQSRVNDPPVGSQSAKQTNYDVDTIASALRSLSTSQSALKKIDGSAHEFYQRTHKSRTNLAASIEDEDEEDGVDDKTGSIGSLKVAGRMSRKANRVSCIADALFAAELCELIMLAPPSLDNDELDTNEEIEYDEDGTLASWTERKVILNTTITPSSQQMNFPVISVIVIYDPSYRGGAGATHGGVDDLLQDAKDELMEQNEEDGDDAPNITKTDGSLSSPRGRYLVMLSENAAAANDDLTSTISTLDTPPRRLRLRTGGAASVCDPLYQMAGKVVKTIGPVLMESNDSKKEADDRCEEKAFEEEGNGDKGKPQRADITGESPAIHIVGFSLAGGVAAISATILDGSLPMPADAKRRHTAEESDENEQTPVGRHNDESASRTWSGCARDRVSAICLGPPPCISSNLKPSFVKSIIHGDDIVSRATQATLDRLYERARRGCSGGVLGRSVGWMTDVVSLTVSGMKSQSSKNEQERLAVPGNVFLIRPRRMGGGSSSIHEVGGTGGRESLRAAVLWQLNDVLLSGSMIKHHSLDQHIRSLDRVQLQGFTDASDDE